ncbi:MAG: rhodanese-like domain-containing protein [Bacteroidales bacterium]|nr:rhodanese-like domain-containing protein [Bacteroidales bacterium]
MTTTIVPKLQDFHINGVKHITPEESFELLKNGTAVILDVREAEEVSFERIADAKTLYIPLAEVILSLDKLPHDKTLIVVCRAGIRSAKIANLLNYQGFPNALNLDGGINMWKSFGLPMESSNSRSCGCGCNCGG